MGDIVKFRMKDGSGVQETLLEALDQQFDEVVVVGIKDNTISSCKSSNASILTWLGCLEYLKTYLYNRLSGIE